MSGRVRLFPLDVWGCGHYRMYWPAMAVQQIDHGFDDVGVVAPDERKVAIQFSPYGGVARESFPVEAGDVVVFQRPSSLFLPEVFDLLQARGVTVVVDMDDDLANCHPSNPAWAGFHPRYDNGHSWHVVAECCRKADLVTVTTPQLARRYGKHGRCRVIPNMIPAQALQIGHRDSTDIGWAGNVQTHPGDLRVMGPSVAQLVSKGVTFRTVGDSREVADELGLRATPPSTGPVPFDRYLVSIAEFGIGVAPLAKSIFNQSKCLDAKTRIATRRGIVPIGEVELGDHVWCDGRWRMVQASESQPATTGVALTTWDGRMLRLTDDHRLWINGQWTEARAIRPGARVRLTPDAFGATELVRAPWPSDGRASRGAHDRQAFVSAPDVPHVTINERWGRFLGIFAGDGSATGTAVTISCDGQDADLIELISDDVRAMGLWPSTQRVRTWGGELLRRRAIWVSSTHLIRFLRSLGVIEPGSVRRIVRVPEVIWRSPREVVAAFLAGLFEADGTSDRTSVSLSTKHHAFALEVQQLLVTFGIESFVSEHFNNAKRGGPKFPSYKVRLRRAGADLFAKNIGFLSERKRARLEAITVKPHSNAYRPQTWEAEVVSVDRCWLQPVDIQVDGGVFAAAGFVSHNSRLKILEYSATGVPWVGSPTEDYLLFHGEGCGQIAEKPKDWLRCLTRLVKDEAFRLEESAAGREVAARHTLEGNAWRWAEAWHDASTSR